MAEGLSATEIRARVDAHPYWWHSIDLGHGIVTPGRKSARYLQYELKSLRLPDMRGKTVLDIGAWDGFYSFEAERRGAQVTALDNQVWQALRGGFDTAHAALRSKVRAVDGDFMTMDLAPLGQFDVVLFLGVLYHMENPLEALRRVRSLTRGVAVIETHAVYVPGAGHRALCEFYPGSELNNDPSNWWGPNIKALKGLCFAAGFSAVTVVKKYWPLQVLFSALRRGKLYFRAVVHARA